MRRTRRRRAPSWAASAWHLLAEQKNTIGMNRGSLRRGSDEEPRDERPTLADVGVDKMLSMRSQKVGGIGLGFH
jgi:hypothetical protein